MDQGGIRNVTARRLGWGRVLIALLAGGSLFSACETRFRDAIISGTKGYLSGLFDAPAILGIEPESEQP
jgi:hypothetical protein